MLGTIVNTLAVIAGSAVGLVFHARLPKRITAMVFQAIGLFTLFIGVKMAWETTSLLILIFSAVIGGILGEALRLEERLNGLADRVRRRLGSESHTFGQAWITATLLFCTGSMTILGSIEEGLGNPPNLLLAKSVLDGFASVALSAALGVGVLLAALSVLAIQGSLTLLAATIQPWVSAPMIAEMTAVGGLMLMGLGLTLLEIKPIKVVSLLPGLLVAPLLALLFL